MQLNTLSLTASLSDNLAETTLATILAIFQATTLEISTTTLSIASLESVSALGGSQSFILTTLAEKNENIFILNNKNIAIN
ncbi:9914_t:CDS:2 [Dentiscutata heterogama]|uniref:9914_t:CDS:1 n=1 Tax=Dentiscutata heterogama TaxID=1316150 RepID=A0ACA9KLW0_9GLOM|nr:9914_t:CDS:2 [Dentiscutata heterogama]